MSFFSCAHKVAFVLVFLFMTALAWAWDARVVEVVDGDTITVEPVSGGERMRVRLHGIDTPEMRQPYGQAARDFVLKTVLFQTVDVQEAPQRKDRYGRTIAVVRVDEKNLQAELIKAGLAWVWPRYCKNCGEWEELQDDARSFGRGLWRDEHPVPPWLWRRK